MKETSITHIIKELRVLKAAAMEERSTEKWAELRRNHLLIAYTDLDSDNENSKRVGPFNDDNAVGHVALPNSTSPIIKSEIEAPSNLG